MTNQRSEPIAADRPMTRRGVLGFAAAIPLGALLAACGEDDGADVGGDDPADAGDADGGGDSGARPMGVDVSAINGSVDWSSVRNAGHQFAIVKATDGVDGVDAQFAANWAGAQAARLARGAYHFFHHEAEGAAQAQHFLATVGSDLGELSPVLDVGSESPAIAEIQAWLDAVEQAAGVTPMIYVDVEFADEQLAGFGSYPLWVADFQSSTSPTLPDGWTTWTVWQHNGRGRVAGIDGGVDLNVYAGALPG